MPLVIIGAVFLLVRAFAADPCTLKNSCAVSPAHAAKGTQLMQSIGVARAGQHVNLANKQLSQVLTSGQRGNTQKLLDSVQELVQESIGRNVSVHESVFAAFLAAVESILDDAAVDHTEDQGEVDRAKQGIQNCTNKALSDFSKAGGVDDLASQTGSHRASHDSCRGTQKSYLTEKQEKCDAFQAYASGLKPPSCMKTISWDAPSQAMKDCIAEMAAWNANSVASIYGQKENACNGAKQTHSDKKSTCDSDQGIFESTFCSYHQALMAACNDQTSCREAAIGVRNTVHAEVLVAQDARKDSYRAAKQIECFIAVLKAPQAEQPDKFAECKELSVSTSHLEVTFNDIPTDRVCDTTPVATKPCDSTWEQTEYTSKKEWYGYSVDHSYVPARPDSTNPTETLSTSSCAPCASATVPATVPKTQAGAPVFNLSPPIDGKSVWNLNTDGPLAISQDGAKYTLTPQSTFTVDVKMWGAGGGHGSYGSSGDGGGGGFTKGDVEFQKGVAYYAFAGTAGGLAGSYTNGGSGGLPGGGYGTRGDASGAGGGGYTGLFKATHSQGGALLIAGGGGGGTGYSGDAGAGGGSTGEDRSGGSVTGGSQTAGGTGSNTPGTALQGGNARGEQNSGSDDGGGGGGGYFGGGGGYSDAKTGGGGSGFVSSTSDVTGGTSIAGSGHTPGGTEDADFANYGIGGNNGGSTVATNGYLLLKGTSAPQATTTTTTAACIPIYYGSTQGSNSCPEGGSVITDEATCRLAKDALGKNGGFSLSTYSHIPTGCQFTGSTVYFDTNPSNTAHSGHTPICAGCEVACDVQDRSALSSKFPCKCGTATCSDGEVCTSDTSTCETACDVHDGSTWSSVYPCACGTATCGPNQLCTSASNTCADTEAAAPCANTVNAHNAMQVRTTAYASMKSHKKFVIHPGATFVGTWSPTHQHSDYVVLAGGSIDCTTFKLGSGFERIHVMKGGKVNLKACDHGGSRRRDQGGTSTKLYVEDFSDVTWPDGVSEDGTNWPGTLEKCAPQINGLKGDGECTRQCNNGGSENNDCSACTSCDGGFSEQSDCTECEYACAHGTQSPLDCLCTCDPGWWGEKCDDQTCPLSIQNIGPSRRRSGILVNTTDFQSTKSHTQFVIQDGATFIGTSSPTHQHSDYVVMKGGSIDCTTLKLGSGFERIWVQEGGHVDLKACDHGGSRRRDQGGTSTKLNVENLNDITWPDGVSADGSEWPGTLRVCKPLILSFPSCSSTDGSQTTSYPCKCGTSTCLMNEKCDGSSNTCAGATTTTPSVPTGGLTHAFFFDGDTKDGVGAVAGGQSNGMAYVADRNGKANGAIDFTRSTSIPTSWNDGNAAYLQLPSFLINTAIDFSVCMWLKPKDGEIGLIYNQGGRHDNGGLTFGVNIPAAGGFFTILGQPRCDYILVDSQDNTWTTTWQHNCITYEHSTKSVRVYHNGNEVSVTSQEGAANVDGVCTHAIDLSTADVSASASTPTLFGFGGAYTSSAHMKMGYNGALDDFLVYNKTLSGSEVVQIYNAPASAEQA